MSQPTKNRLLGSWIAGVLGASFGLPLLAILCLKFGKQAYSDIIVGAITWEDLYKSGDFRFVYGIIALFGASFVFAYKRFPTRWLSALARGLPIESTSNAHTGLALFLLGFISSLTVLGAAIPYRELTMAVMAIGAFYLATDAIAAFAVAVFWFLVPISIAVIFGYFEISLGASANTNLFALSSLSAILAAGVSLKSPRWQKRLLLCAQVLLPALLLRYAFLNYFSASRVDVLRWEKVPTLALIGFIVGASAWGVVRLRRFWNQPQRSLREIISWPAVTSVLAYIAWRSAGPSGLEMDDFHLGELVLPWHQAVQWKKKIFDEFVLIQGLLGLSHGALNEIFFGGKAFAFDLVSKLEHGLASVILSLGLYFTAGPVWALVVGVFGLAIFNRLYLVAPAFLILAAPRLWAQPVVWLSAYAVVTALHCLWNSAAGLGVALACFPAAVFQLHQVLKHSRNLTRQGWLAAVSAVGVFTFLAPLLWRVLLFMRENGEGYDVAHGIALVQSLYSPSYIRPTGFHIVDRLLFELARTGSGFLAGFFLVWLVARSWNQHRALGYRFYVWLLGAPLFFVAMIPYSLGRIDAGDLSRVGSVSLLMLGFFIPMALRAANLSILKMPVVAAIAGLSLGTCLTFSYSSPTNLVNHAVHAVSVSDEYEWSDHALGRGYFLKHRLEELNSLRTVLSRFTAEHEAYFDLSNRPTLYVLLNRPVAAPYASDYIAANDRIQKRVIRSLEESPPPLVITGPAIRWETGPASLRAYRIYRWFLRSGYLPQKNYLVHPSRLPETERLPLQLAHKYLRETFYLENLSMLPTAWGRNFMRMKERFKENSDRPDFVLVEFEPSSLSKQQQDAKLLWKGGQFRFRIKGDRALIPVGSDPVWLLSKEPKKVRIESARKVLSFKLLELVD